MYMCIYVLTVYNFSLRYSGYTSVCSSLMFIIRKLVLTLVKYSHNLLDLLTQEEPDDLFPTNFNSLITSMPGTKIHCYIVTELFWL
jgi:hypothetical protein